MSRNLKGIKDEPLMFVNQDKLGIKNHAEILTKFVKACDHPMTLALQGDWGSGKTSLMQMIRSDIEKESESNSILTIWFNTWQYAQNSIDENISLSLIELLIDKLTESISANNSSPESKAEIEKFNKLVRKQKLAKILKTGVNIAAGYISGGAVSIDSNNDNEKQSSEPPINLLDSAKELASLNGKLKSIVSNICNAEKGYNRIIIFVDDIDRLVPKRAVELLESIKNFMDIPNCVFVLACDYKIVSQGLKEKFGVGDGEVNGRSFFDKIIQVPYNMPTHLYDANEYIKDLLEKINIEDKSDHNIKRYHTLLNTSVGVNPRALKRLFNAFLLLELTTTEQGIFENLSINNKTIHINETEKELLLFSVLCLQNAYEKAFYTMLNESLDEAWFDSIINHSQNSRANKDSDTADNSKATLFFKRANLTSSEDQKKFQNFLEAFLNSIQLAADGDDDTLSEMESEVLRKIMNSSKVVSVGEASINNSEKQTMILPVVQKIARSLNEHYTIDTSENEGDNLYYDNEGDYEIYFPVSEIENTWVYIGFSPKPQTVNVYISLFCEKPRKTEGWKKIRQSFPNALNTERKIDWAIGAEGEGEVLIRKRVKNTDIFEFEDQIVEAFSQFRKTLENCTGHTIIRKN